MITAKESLAFGSGPRRSISRALVVALLVAVSPLPCIAQPAGGVIGELARQWSGNTSPRCEQQSTGGKMVDGQIDPWECEWSAAVGDNDLGRIWGLLDEHVSAVMWSRVTVDAAEADRVADSLSVAFTARGLRKHGCGVSELPDRSVQAVLWEGPDLAIHILRTTLQHEPPQFLLSATNAPALMPASLRCDM